MSVHFSLFNFTKNEKEKKSVNDYLTYWLTIIFRNFFIEKKKANDFLTFIFMKVVLKFLKNNLLTNALKTLINRIQK